KVRIATSQLYVLLVKLDTRHAILLGEQHVLYVPTIQSPVRDSPRVTFIVQFLQPPIRIQSWSSMLTMRAVRIHPSGGGQVDRVAQHIVIRAISIECLR